jgi:acetyl-CoA C-acetyltransferase
MPATSARSHQVAVVGSAQTLLRDAWLELQHVDLISTVVTEALRGTSLSIADVDFVIDAGSDVLDGRSISNCGFLGASGAHHKEESRVEDDGLWAAMYAAAKIRGGGGGVGLVVAHSKPSESDLRGFSSTLCEPFYQRPLGLDHVSAAGLQAHQYATRTGAGPDEFALVAARAWEGAVRNQQVETLDAPTIDDIRSAETVASPLRAHELARPRDGAVAVLLADATIARRTTPDPVWITGMGSATDQHMLAAREPGALPACRAAAATAYARAGIADPSAIELAEVSANSAAGELMVLEALGLAGAGRGIELYEDDARIALNRSGGALPADPVMATGLVRLAEAALQLTGRIDHAAEGARNGVVHGATGLGMQNHCVMTVEVDQ